MKPHYGYIHKSHTTSMKANVASLLISRKPSALQYFGIFDCVLSICKAVLNVRSLQESDYIYITLDSFLSSVKAVFAH